jgi:hypothetical protein
MTSRREFLEAAALAVPAIAGAQLASAASAKDVGSTGDSGRVIPASLAAGLHLVIFDARYAQARSAAARVGRAGAVVHPLADGDVTQIWLDQIGPAWQRGPVAIAGVTARPALFCLEQLALSSGLRVVFHAEHIVHASGRAEHSLLRGADSVGLSPTDLTHAGQQWSARVADALATYRPDAARSRFGRSHAALEPVLPPGAQLLTSWIIAAA